MGLYHTQKAPKTGNTEIEPKADTKNTCACKAGKARLSKGGSLGECRRARRYQCIGVARPQRTPARWGCWGRHPNALGWIYPNALGSTPNRWGMMWGQSHMRWVEFSVIVVWHRGMASGRLASTRNVFNRCHLTKRKRCCAVNVADLFDVAAASRARSRSASMSEGMSQCCRRAPGCATRFRCAPRRTERGSLTCAGRGSPAGRRAPRPFLY